MTHMLENFLKDIRGMSSIEYGLLIGLVALGIIIALGQLGQSTSSIIQQATDTFDQSTKSLSSDPQQ